MRITVEQIEKSESRFFEKIEFIPFHSCWEFKSLRKDGYGRFFIGKLNGRPENIPAHRASWMIHHGPIIGNSHVLHKCDNRSCVRPEHLFLGTHTDNMRDCASKGRNVNKRAEAQKKLTHCPQGHPYSGENLLIYDGKRKCRYCFTSNGKKERAIIRALRESISASLKDVALRGIYSLKPNPLNVRNSSPARLKFPSRSARTPDKPFDTPWSCRHPDRLRIGQINTS